MSASFDRTLAETKLFWCEKYKKASEGDLRIFENILNAEVVKSLDGKTARIKCMNNTTDVDIIG